MDPQRALSTQTRLTADAHADKRGIWLLGQLSVVLDAVGVDDMSAQEEQGQAL